jgi:Spy/CpxP family protein refolding chaperone
MTRIALAAALALIAASLAPTGSSWAQTPGPYAGEQNRAIKALSAKEFDDLAQGRGMGLAKAAELNRYPGPMHGLELAEPLNLSDHQRETLKAIMARMSADAKSIGADLLGLERELDAAFVQRTIDAKRLKTLTERIGVTQAALRAVHLAAHLEAAVVLSAEQIARYDVLRGYAGASTGAPTHGKH